MYKPILNWNKLYSLGDCKTLDGEVWSDEEREARRKKVPAEYVRQGVLTYEEYLGKKTQDDKERDEVIKKARAEELKKILEETKPKKEESKKDDSVDTAVKEEPKLKARSKKK